MSISDHLLALQAGYELGKYRFKEILGSGGFGITYLAEDRSLKRQVAIKELLPNDIATRVDGTTVAAKTKGDEGSLAWALERFVNEGRALAACEHPNVVHVYEIVEANGTAYMITKYEDGCSLEKWLQNLGRIPTESELTGILMPLLSGLEKVHQTGFLHRDIKPDNIYITSGGRPLLLDFGSARQAVSNRSMAMTSIVTGGYAPFEQYYEDGNQGAWSDIYAIGAVIYRAITGKKPPEATRRLKDDSCEKLSERFAGQYSPEFLGAVDQALAMNEADRPQSIAAWRAMLSREALDVTVVVPKKNPVQPPAPAPASGTPPERVNAKAIGAFAGVIVALTAIIWGVTRGKPQPNSEPVQPKVMKAVPVQAAPAPVVNDSSSKQTDSVSAPLPQPAASPVAAPEAVAVSESPAPQVPVLDPHIVGSWQNGITKAKRQHLEIWDNGSWQMWGPVNDTGTYTADGWQIWQLSSNTGQWMNSTYKLDDETLVTKSGTSTITWKHPVSASGDSESSSSRKNRTPPKSPIGTFFKNLFHGPQKK